ncbi:MAG TPA: hypothetical protein VNJ01_15420 [Bacteriovoracaceae bacterium]|nr:hypothetical protein [Bacteriovoracaceae bacterium]
MNILAWLLGLSVLISIMFQAVSFHKATACRQKAWLTSAELLTAATLTDAPTSQNTWLPSCRIQVKKNPGSVSWIRFPDVKKHTFQIQLKGKL